MNIDHRKLLKDTKALVENEKYEEALAAYKKFFKDSANIHSLTGVRLSYCLMDWKVLGDKFPPALDSLEELQVKTCTKVERFINHSGDEYSKKVFNRIHELVSINSILDKNSESIALFKKFDEQNSNVAKSFYIPLKDILLEAKEYALCYKYMQQPDQFVFEWKVSFDCFIELEEQTPSDIQESILEHHMKELNYTLFVLAKNEREEVADSIRTDLSNHVRDKGYEQYIGMIK